MHFLNNKVKLIKYKILNKITFGLIPGFKQRIVSLLNNEINIAPKKDVVFPSSKCSFNKYAVIISGQTLSTSNLYRVNSKLYALEKMGFEFKLFSYHSLPFDVFNELQLASLLIFYRVPFDETVKSYYTEANRLGVKIFYDIDDLIFDSGLYSEYLHLYDEFPNDKQQKASLKTDYFSYKNAVEHSDVLLGSTNTICDIAKKSKNEVFLLENYVNKELIESYNESAHDSYEYFEDKLIIFYESRDISHNDDFLVCANALNKILKKYPHVYLFIIGELELSCFEKSVLDKVIFIDEFISKKEYYSLISKLDINIVPLTKGIFSDSKSNIKFIEASFFSIPSVCSPRTEFSKIINNKNGILAENDSEWFKSLEMLVVDEAFRKKMGYEARRFVLDKYSLPLYIDRLKRLFDYDLFNFKKRKILLVNVFYGKSSYGGATIVVEKLAEYIKKSSQYIPIVFTLHIGDISGKLVKYDWNDVTVYSYGIDKLSGENFSFSSPFVYKKFERILAVEKPAIVHAHSIQGIGLEIFSSCKKFDIPYVITMHDLWWCCPRQFMIDIKGNNCVQEKRDPLVCRHICGMNVYDETRRIKLTNKVFLNAKKIFVPSNKFASKLRTDFDFVKIDVSENGISKVEHFHYIKEQHDGIINFGYVGGKEKIKGYDVLVEAFKEVDISSYKLHLTDNLTKFGGSYQFEQDFLSENIVVYPYLSTKEMDEFYSKIDVLIFPSNCFESFGLTVREAISKGVFVICSKCGGPEEAVTNLDNGLIFEKGSPSDLTRCIQYVIRNIEKIRCKDKWNYGNFKGFAEQSSELLGVYENIINGNI